MLRASQIAQIGLSVLLFTGLWSASIPSAAASGQNNVQASSWDLPTRIIIKTESGSAFGQRSSASANLLRQSVSTATHLPVQMGRKEGDLRFLTFDRRLSEAEVAQVIADVAGIPGVAAVEEDPIVTAAFVPNDPAYATDQWYLRRDLLDPDTQEYSYGINIEGAWELTQGDPNVVVAVLDSGYTDHPEFENQILPGYNFASYTASGAAGTDSDAHDLGNPAGNSSWHGTLVSGVIGATANNSAGISGIAWQSKILPVRVLNDRNGYKSDILAGIRWATGLPIDGIPTNPNPAQVINLSIASLSPCDSNLIPLQETIDAAVETGTIVVVAAGNKNTYASGYSPANCNNVIVVTGTNEVGGRWFSYSTVGSNYGANVDVSAPGTQIYTTSNTGDTAPSTAGYAFATGTSLSTPQVAGVIALLLSLRPDLSTSDVEYILSQTARPFPEGSECLTVGCGAGILDASAAVRLASIKITQISSPTIFTNQNTPVQLSGSGFPLDAGVFIGGVLYPTQNNTSTSLDFTITAGSLPDGEYLIQICSNSGQQCSVAEATRLSVESPVFLPVIAR
ncbi:MAG TPA: S8 family serine peptidase [Anaerolineaceae bacterium]|nr:S8 family serine peptidase [Anaerolineaceae bacterium]